MAIEQHDPMEEFEAEFQQARERNTSVPFFFSLKDGDKAQVRLLLNFPQNVRMDYHEYYNKPEQRWDANNVCAKALEQECFYCDLAKTSKDWHYKAQRHIYLPVYVHWVRRLQADRTWGPVTYKQDGEELTVCGVRMLDMKFSSTILVDLKDVYTEDADNPAARDITRYDFMIQRRGSGLETRYTVNAKSGAPLPLPIDLPLYTQELVAKQIIEQRPIKTVDAPADPAERDDGDRWG